MITIGPYALSNPVILAPMAGVTDRPFRQLCRQFGAAMAVSEMVSSDSRLWHSRKSKSRLDHNGEQLPISVQIAGADPSMMAEAAQLNVARGAQIVDINMGCPAKKVCKKAAGSALMRDEKLVKEILTAVVNAVDVPVTLKTRTGWDTANRNGPTIAKIAEDAGIAAIAMHGRTRACAYKGEAEYDTIAATKRAVAIPVIANGDITTVEKAKQVMDYTGADAVMIGRAAQGQPWLCGQIAHYLATGEHQPAPALALQQQVLLKHVQSLHGFYGELMGVRIARKHVGWYTDYQLEHNAAKRWRRHFNALETAPAQLEAINYLFEAIANGEEIAA